MSKSVFLPATETVDTNLISEKILDLLYLGEGVDSFASLLRDVEHLPQNHPQRLSLLRSIQKALSLGERLEQHRQNERGLRAVFESAQALTGLKELNQVLSQIVELGRKLLGSDLAWLSDVDHASGRWKVLAVDGNHTHDLLHMNPPINKGIAGHVLKTRMPFFTPEYATDSRFAHNAETDLSVTSEGLRSVIGVPLLSDDQVIGILIVGDRYARSHFPWEISTLTILAAHASVAVRNAQAYDLTRSALAEAETAYARLKQQTESLEFAADAHDRLSQLLAKGGNLKQLIQVIAQMLGGQVMFLDAAGIEKCVATASSYKAPEVIGSDKIVSGIDSSIQSAISRSRVSGRSVVAETVRNYHCQVVALMSGDELLGALLVHSQQKLSEQYIRIFERGATATIVLCLSAEKKSGSVYQEINFTVRALLDPSQHEGSDLISGIERHGLDIAAPIVLATIDVEREKIGYVTRRLAGHFRTLSAMVADIDGYIVLLINHGDICKLESELQTLLFSELGLTGLACVSGPHLGLTGLVNAYPSTKRSISLLHKLKRKNCVVHESALGMYAILFHQNSAEDLDALIDSVIGRLIAHDVKRNAQFADTLLAYLDNMQNARATAGQLGIHVNTLNNRLESIASLLGAWNSDGRTVEVHLALRLQQLKRNKLAPGG